MKVLAEAGRQSEYFAGALRAVTTILSESRGDGRLVRALEDYFEPDGDYAGQTFSDLGVNPTDRINGDDLLAVTTLSISFVPRAIRRLVTQPPESLMTALRSLREAESSEDPEILTRMSAFYREVKKILGPRSVKESNRWVAASKICARKFPGLFPIRDRKVHRLLDIPCDAPDDFWTILHALIEDDDLADLWTECLGNASADYPFSLRNLDVALWMNATGRMAPEWQSSIRCGDSRLRHAASFGAPERVFPVRSGRTSDEEAPNPGAART